MFPSNEYALMIQECKHWTQLKKKKKIVERKSFYSERFSDITEHTEYEQMKKY